MPKKSTQNPVLPQRHVQNLLWHFLEAEKLDEENRHPHKKDSHPPKPKFRADHAGVVTGYVDDACPHLEQAVRDALDGRDEFENMRAFDPMQRMNLVLTAAVTMNQHTGKNNALGPHLGALEIVNLVARYKMSWPSRADGQPDHDPKILEKVHYAYNFINGQIRNTGGMECFDPLLSLNAVLLQHVPPGSAIFEAALGFFASDYQANIQRNLTLCTAIYQTQGWNACQEAVRGSLQPLWEDARVIGDYTALMQVVIETYNDLVDATEDIHPQMPFLANLMTALTQAEDNWLTDVAWSNIVQQHRDMVDQGRDAMAETILDTLINHVSDQPNPSASVLARNNRIQEIVYGGLEYGDAHKQAAAVPERPHPFRGKLSPFQRKLLSSTSMTPPGGVMPVEQPQP